MGQEKDQIELLLLDVRKNISDNIMFLKDLDLDAPQDVVQDLDNSGGHENNDADNFEEL